MTISESIQNYLDYAAFKLKPTSMRGYDLTLRQFAVFMRDIHIERVTEKDVTEWFHLMRKLNWDHNAIIPKAIALRKLFEYHTRRGAKVLDPWFIPVSNKEYKMPRVVSKENFEKLLASIPKNNDPRHIRNRALLLMYWDTVARNSEPLALDMSDLEIDKGQGQATIKTKKSRGKRPIRQIFWRKDANDALMAWLEKRSYLAKKTAFRNPEAVFVSCAGGKIGCRFTNKGVAEMLRRYSKLAGLETVNAHSIRHRGCRDISKLKGASAVMNIAGHASLASSSVYTMLDGDELEELARSIHR